MTFTVRSWGRAFEVPPAVFEDVRVVKFMGYLERTHELEPAQARKFVEAIVAQGYMEIGESFARTAGPLFNEIVRIRTEIQTKYAALLDHFGARRGIAVLELPPELRPAAFRDLFSDLAKRIDELTNETIEGHTNGMPPTDLTDDVEVTIDRVWRELEGEDLPEPGSRGRRERPERGGPGVVESERAERLYYVEALRGKEPREARTILQRAARRLFLFPDSPWRLPSGWKVRLVKSPEYGPRIAQQAAFAGVDPLFAANGYELHFTTDTGVKFQPDAVQLFEDGTLKFHEFKDPLRQGSVESYRSSRDLQAELLDTLTKRAEAARSLPGCHGWNYDTSVAEMNRFIFDVLNEELPIDSPLRDYLEVADPDGRTL